MKSTCLIHSLKSFTHAGSIFSPHFSSKRSFFITLPRASVISFTLSSSSSVYLLVFFPFPYTYFCLPLSLKHLPFASACVLPNTLFMLLCTFTHSLPSCSAMFATFSLYSNVIEGSPGLVLARALVCQRLCHSTPSLCFILTLAIKFTPLIFSSFSLHYLSRFSSFYSTHSLLSQTTFLYPFLLHLSSALTLFSVPSPYLYPLHSLLIIPFSHFYSLNLYL